MILTIWLGTTPHLLRGGDQAFPAANSSIYSWIYHTSSRPNEVSNNSSMEQALQQWRFAYGIEDEAFESLIAVISTHGFNQEIFSADSFAPPVLSPSFLSNIDDGVSEQNKATSNAPTMSQFWPSYAESMLFPTSEANSSTTYVSPTHSAGAAPLSNAIVSEPVEDSAWNPIIAQKKNYPITCVKCWAEKKKVYVGDFLRQGMMTNGSLILVRLGNSMQEMHRSNNDSFTPSFVPASPFG